MLDFFKDNSLAYSETDSTYIGPNGTEVSTIDYIVYDQKLTLDVKSVLKLDMKRNPYKCPTSAFTPAHIIILKL